VLNPLAAYSKRFTLEEIMNDMMIAYPNTRPMCSANCDGAAAAVVVSESKLRTLSLEQQRRAVKISASVLTTDPYEEACQILPNVNTLTRNAAKIAYEQAGVGPEDLEPRRAARLLRHRRARALRQPHALPRGWCGRLLRVGCPVARRLDPGERVGRSAVEGPPDLGDRHRQRVGGVPPPPRRGRPRQIEGAKVGLAHVIGLGSACGIHILEKSTTPMTTT
jgi:acetyl-CoA acyltransferase